MPLEARVCGAWGRRLSCGRPHHRNTRRAPLTGEVAAPLRRSRQPRAQRSRISLLTRQSLQRQCPTPHRCWHLHRRCTSRVLCEDGMCPSSARNCLGRSAKARRADGRCLVIKYLGNSAPQTSHISPAALTSGLPADAFPTKPTAYPIVAVLVAMVIAVRRHHGHGRHHCHHHRCHHNPHDEICGGYDKQRLLGMFVESARQRPPRTKQASIKTKQKQQNH